MSMVKMVIISATGSAFKRTIPSLKNSSYCKVVAIHGRNADKLSKICMDYKIPKYYLDIDEMLEKEDYDLIYIANPPFMHYDSLIKAKAFNRPIICEKPLGLDYESAIKIRKALENYSQPVMIAHHLRHQKAYNDIISIVNSRKIGDVTEVYCQWGFKLNVEAPNAIWKLNPKLGGNGTFSDNGIHIIDLIIGIFGDPLYVGGNCIKTVFDQTYDTETAMLCYNDKTITLSSSQNMLFPGNNIQIYGTNGKIEGYGCIGEKSISKLLITTDDGQKEYIYDSTNLYCNEVENFIKYYILKESSVYNGTTLDQAVSGLKVIELIRKSYGNKTFYLFDSEI